MIKILFTGNTFTPKEIQNLSDQGYKIISVPDNLDEESLINELKQVDAYIVGGKEIVSEKVIKSVAKNLKLISFFGVGFGNIDLEAAQKYKIFVTNTPKVNSYSVAEFTVALLLTLNKNIIQHINDIQKNIWQPVEFYDLADKTLGIIGMGHIGTNTARILYNGFRMKIVFSDIVEKTDAEKEFNAQKVSLEKLLKISDFISLHIPLNENTKNIIGKSEFKKMKKTAILINTSRAELVDPEALYNALHNNDIIGAAFDGFYTEPVEKNKPENKLFNLPKNKFILTPHTGYNAFEAVARMQKMTIENIKKFFS
jgi:D-3-phosphoglycerate dehydrogenase / 2-oxoglutarate reductase